MSEIIAINTPHGIFQLGDRVTEIETPNEIRTLIELSKYSCILDNDKIRSYQNISLYIEPKFVLPELWYIKITEENFRILSIYRSRLPQPRSGSDVPQYLIGMYISNRYDNYNGYIFNRLDYRADNYTEITFEQFKKYVLNE